MTLFNHRYYVCMAINFVCLKLNKLYCTALHCTALHCKAPPALPCLNWTEVHWKALPALPCLNWTGLHCTALVSTVLCCTVKHRLPYPAETGLHCTALDSTVLCYALLWCEALPCPGLDLTGLYHNYSTLL